MLNLYFFSFTKKYLLLWVAFCWALPSNSLAQYYSFAHYSIEEGLPQTSVNHFAQDQFGYLWVATSGGLSRFDGQNFQNFGMQDGLSSSYVTHILETSNKQLAIATYNGLTIYDGDTFTSYTITNQSGKNLEVRRVFEHSNGRLLLLLPQNQLAFWSPDTVNLLSIPDIMAEKYITGMVQTSPDTYWATTYDGDLLNFNGAEWEMLSVTHPSQPNFNRLYRDESGQFWLIGEQGLFTYQPKDTVFREFVFKSDLPGAVFSLMSDTEERMWAATANGVFCFNPKTGKVNPKSHGLDGSVVRDIFQDREGNIWFGSYDEGMFKFRGETFTHLRTEHGLYEKSVFSIIKDRRDDYWFSYIPGGLDRYDGEKVHHYGPKEGLLNDFIYCSVEDSAGNLWFGSSYGLTRYDGESFYSIPPDELPNRRILSSFRDSDNNLWFGTAQGVVKYQNGQFASVQGKRGQQCNSAITVIDQMNDQRMVFGTKEGVYLWDGTEYTLLLEDYAAQSEYVLTMALDDHQSLWFSTINGLLFRYYFSTGELLKMHEKTDVPPEIIYTMEVAHDGSLVMGTQRGVYRFLLNQRGEVKQMMSYGKNDGFTGMESNANASFVEEDGSIWMGTVDGAYKLQPKTQLEQLTPLVPHLTEVQLQYQTVDWNEHVDSVQSWFQIPVDLTLSHRENHIIFFYQGVSLLNADKVCYQFKLDNFDEAWSPVTKRTEAVYANVPPGNYTFQVRSRNARGVWSEPTAFAFSVSPPFWQTWWFYLGLATLIGLLIRTYSLWNLRNERKQRKELELEVNKRTQEIQNLNDSLEDRVHQRTYQLEESTRQLAEEVQLREKHQRRVARQEREYRLLVNNLREVIFKSDTDGYFTFLNKRWEAFTGYSVEESLGQNYLVIIHPEEQEKYSTYQQKLLTGDLPFIEEELRVVKKDGTIVWGKVSARIERNAEGNPAGISGSLMDIDQRKQAEFALRGSEEKYRFLAENTQDIITLQDLSMGYTYVSPRIREVAGHDPENLIGKTSFEFLHPDDRDTYEAFRRQVMEKQELASTTLRFMTTTGVYHYYETSLKPIFDENQRVIHFISSSRDVTQKVKLTQEIEKVRKKVAQDFHDEMGNNLASISVLSQIIQSKLGVQTNGIGSLLTKIDTASKNLFYGTRDFIWAIDPRNDNVQEVYFNLKDFGEELFENTGISFLASFETCEEQQGLNLPSGWSHQIVLIFKEALTNALKYAQANTVQLEFNVCDDAFEAILQDDGVGFDLHSSQQTFRGIKNMQERARKIGLHLGLKSACQQGTKVNLRGKITQNGVEN
ncbi:PAS domain S-box protein [Tunicatimonas pelagia]|uniref:PAS domain S-box protein n=1 Tax=Tunicatimonas pelagia TaxID=931531 RepID=UPI0026663A9C|nr:PAS domain S-box protein [Tunicatimonas pelagia]WKN44456.1 PAS domain S-box protein [Tunicatimonas pelagia]